MSDLHVPLTTVDDVRPHPNADKLDIAVVKGWQVVVGKDSLVKGYPVVFIPPDAVVSDEWAMKWGIYKPAADLNKGVDYRGKGGRIRAVRLRGEPSFGLVIAVDFDLARDLAKAGFKSEDNVASFFGITKYVPPARPRRGVGGETDTLREYPLFYRYTDIENLRHNPTLFDGLEVVITEKIHGANSRVGYIDGTAVAGSHRVQRKHPSLVRNEAEYKAYEAAYGQWHASLSWPRRWWYDTFGGRPPRFDINITTKPSVYWRPFEIDGVKAMLHALGRLHKQVILYGELYGPGVQALTYGVEQGKVAYAAFDLMIDGQYVEHETFEVLCRTFGIPIAPVLATGTATFDDLRQMAEGPTVLNGGPHLMEGIVVKALRGERVVAKLVSDSFLTGKGDKSEDLASDLAEEMVA